MNKVNLENTLQNMTGKRIIVVGDVMIDHYIHGKVNRISPEAPVPLLDMKNEEYRLGGAANVALNIKTMGSTPILIGVYGEDDGQIIMNDLLNAEDICSGYLVIDEQRMTTLKTRIVAGQQQIVRIDREQRNDINTEVEYKVISKFQECITDCDAVIIEDYNKGLLTESVIKAVLEIAKENNKPVTVDPKYKNFFLYKDATVFKPNLVELKNNMNLTAGTDDEFLQAGSELRERLNAENVMVTRGEKGLTVFKSDSSTHSIPSYARDVFDVSGAGDTVISSLTLALAGGATIEVAAEIANYAAGVVCGKIGTSSTKPSEILEYIRRYEH